MDRRRVLLVVTLAAAVVACAAAALPRPPPRTASGDGGLDGSDLGADATASSVDAGLDVAALAERLAPGMREVERTRSDRHDAGGYALAPTDMDRCYRIAIVASDIVDATLTDDAGHVLATARGRNAAVGAKGPVCLRKGQRATLAISGPAELIVWTSP